MTVENLKTYQRIYREYYVLDARLNKLLHNDKPMSKTKYFALHDAIVNRQEEINVEATRLEKLVNEHFSSGSGALQVLMSAGKCFEPYMDVIGGWNILDTPVLDLTGWWGRPIIMP